MNKNEILYLEHINDVIEHGKYKDNEDSLSSYPYPKWYEESKFGIFSHWGVYTVPAFVCEWYPRFIYWKGNPTRWYHLIRYGKKVGYKDMIPMFKPDKFNSREWCDIIKNSGAKFFMPVGEHHDGFKMYESDLSEWNSKDMGPKVDFIRKIKNSCYEKGIEFCTSSHRAEHFWFMNGGRTLGQDNDTLDERYREFYGPCVSIDKKNNLKVMSKHDRGHTPTEEWLENWLVHSCELVEKYKPSAIFFDWWTGNEKFKPYMLKFCAFYCNLSIEWGKTVCVFYKGNNIKAGCIVEDKERGQLGAINDKVWQCETSTTYNAWSYCWTNRYKKPHKIIGNYIDVLSKRGTFCLNIGPKSDGTICKQDKNILSEIGEFNKKNSEAIWGSEPFAVFGEGRMNDLGGCNTGEKYNYKYDDVRFLKKDNVIYAFLMGVKKKKNYIINNLGKQKNQLGQIKRISLLGYNDVKVNFEQANNELNVSLSKKIDTKNPICLKVEL